MAGGKPGGWTRFTRQHRDIPEAVPEADPFPALGNSDGGSRLLAGSGAQQKETFAAVAKKGIDLENEEGSLEAQVYRRLQVMDMSNKAAGAQVGTASELKGAYPWADSTLVEDVVRAVDGDREMAAACLDSMAAPTARCDAGGDTLSQRTAPAEPDEKDSDQNDSYMKYRREAVQAARASQKLGRQAANAYFAGNHSTARILSQQARESRAVADEVNAKAAEAILKERNPGGEEQLWELDLHGLHSSEAVQAVQHRLAQIENKVSEDPVSRFSAVAAPVAAAEDPGPIRAAAKVPSQRLLEIITGVGSHSRGGASIPSAVKKYLVVSEYRFTEPRAGVLAVHPKQPILPLATLPLAAGNVPMAS